MSLAPPTQIETVVGRVLAVYRGWSRSPELARMRADWDALFAPAAASIRVSPVADPAMRAACWLEAPGARADRVVLYLHGGGYQLGSVRSHAGLMGEISAAARCRVLGVDYRLAPEHRFPAAFDDARNAYEWLLRRGHATGHIALAGDSAGGGLVLALLLALRDQAQPLPAAAVALSPWTDLTASGTSYAEIGDRDPIHAKAMLIAIARSYLGGDGDARDPRASPLHGRLHGLPPLLLQAGEREVVLSDSIDFAAKARAAGVEVYMEVWPGMIHVFQQHFDALAEARKAIEAIGAFLVANWERSAR